MLTLTHHTVRVTETSKPPRASPIHQHRCYTVLVFLSVCWSVIVELAPPGKGVSKCVNDILRLALVSVLDNLVSKCPHCPLSVRVDDFADRSVG